MDDIRGINHKWMPQQRNLWRLQLSLKSELPGQREDNVQYLPAVKHNGRERIYNLIEEQQDQDSSNGEGENPDGAASGGEGGTQPNNPSAGDEPTAPATPGGFGQVLDAPEPEGDDSDTVAKQAREWKIAVEQAENVAKLAGKLPAGVTRCLERSETAGVDWRELLRRAWSETIPPVFKELRDVTCPRCRLHVHVKCAPSTRSR